MVRRLFVSVAIILAAIPLRVVKLSHKQGDLAGRNEIRSRRLRGQRDSGIQKVVVSTGELP
jgi:hypothetical protein